MEVELSPIRTPAHFLATQNSAPCYAVSHGHRHAAQRPAKSPATQSRDPLQARAEAGVAVLRSLDNVEAPSAVAPPRKVQEAGVCGRENCPPTPCCPLTEDASLETEQKLPGTSGSSPRGPTELASLSDSSCCGSPPASDNSWDRGPHPPDSSLSPQGTGDTPGVSSAAGPHGCCTRLLHSHGAEPAATGASRRCCSPVPQEPRGGGEVAGAAAAAAADSGSAPGLEPGGSEGTGELEDDDQSSSPPRRERLRLSVRHGASAKELVEYALGLKAHLGEVLCGLPGGREPPTANVREYFVPVQRIGKGHVGTVTLCEEKSTGQKFACKSIPKALVQRLEDADELCSEILTMVRLQTSPTTSSAPQNCHLLRLHEVFEDADAIHLITDYCDGGDLFEYVARKKRLGEQEAAHILIQLLSAVAYMHSLGIVHRDLKPENILLLRPGLGPQNFPLIKLADFGLSVPLLPGRGALGAAGSPHYMAPEVILQRVYGPRVDVWSMGVILYTCLAGYFPFWAETKEEVFERILTAKVNLKKKPWPSLSPEVKALICRMLCPEPSQRASLAEVLVHPWITKNCPALH